MQHINSLRNAPNQDHRYQETGENRKLIGSVVNHEIWVDESATVVDLNMTTRDRDGSPLIMTDPKFNIDWKRVDKEGNKCYFIATDTPTNQQLRQRNSRGSQPSDRWSSGGSYDHHPQKATYHDDWGPGYGSSNNSYNRQPHRSSYHDDWGPGYPGSNESNMGYNEPRRNTGSSDNPDGLDPWRRSREVERVRNDLISKGYNADHLPFFDPSTDPITSPNWNIWCEITGMDTNYPSQSTPRRESRSNPYDNRRRVDNNRNSYKDRVYLDGSMSNRDQGSPHYIGQRNMPAGGYDTAYSGEPVTGYDNNPEFPDVSGLHVNKYAGLGNSNKPKGAKDMNIKRNPPEKIPLPGLAMYEEYIEEEKTDVSEYGGLVEDMPTAGVVDNTFTPSTEEYTHDDEKEEVGPDAIPGMTRTQRIKLEQKVINEVNFKDALMGTDSDAPEGSQETVDTMNDDIVSSDAIPVARPDFVSVKAREYADVYTPSDLSEEGLRCWSEYMKEIEDDLWLDFCTREEESFEEYLSAISKIPDAVPSVSNKLNVSISSEPIDMYDDLHMVRDNESLVETVEVSVDLVKEDEVELYGLMYEILTSGSDDEYSIYEAIQKQRMIELPTGMFVSDLINNRLLPYLRDSIGLVSDSIDLVNAVKEYCGVDDDKSAHQFIDEQINKILNVKFTDNDNGGGYITYSYKYSLINLVTNEENVTGLALGRKFLNSSGCIAIYTTFPSNRYKWYKTSCVDINNDTVLLVNQDKPGAKWIDPASLKAS